MADITDTTTEQKRNYLQGALSLIVPGLGQTIGGAISRGIIILLTVVTLAGLTIWTSTQRARFPDYEFGAIVFVKLLFETAAILIFLYAIYYIINRSLLKEPTQRAASRYAFVIISVLVITFISDTLLETAVPLDLENQIFGLTAVLGAALVAAIWLWNVQDATHIQRDFVPSSTTLILLGALALLILGTKITEVDVEKAVLEFSDTQIILKRIVWPWRGAFEYDADDVSASAKVQAPCPTGATGPEMNTPQADGPWIIVTPNCGELSERDITGELTLGTSMTIEGGNFVPGEIAEIVWANPIGNPFTPRGVGETDIFTNSTGAFRTELNMPDAVVSSTAQGDQIHTLTVVQTGQEIFTGELSRNMKLALNAMVVTIMMGLMATFVGIVFAVPLSFLASRNLMNTIRTSVEGLVGGLFGLVFGIWLGFEIGNRVSSFFFGGFETAPIQTALVYTFIVLISAILFTRVGSRGLSLLSRENIPNAIRIGIGVFGLGIIGALIGYYLGIGFAIGVLGIVYGPEVAAALAPRAAAIGMTVVGGLFGYQGYRLRPGGEVSTGQFIYIGVRSILNIVRSIEPLIWALIGIIWVGPGPFAGFVALTVHTIAALGKLYSESIESIDQGPLEALQAAGATRLQIIVYAVFPQILPPFISFTIYRWDINVRLSTIIGLVGGGGIGFLLVQWLRLGQYQEVGMAVWLITITVAALDFISAEIRERYI